MSKSGTIGFKEIAGPVLNVNRKEEKPFIDTDDTDCSSDLPGYDRLTGPISWVGMSNRFT